MVWVPVRPAAPDRGGRGHGILVNEFIADLSAIAPPAGQGAHAFVDSNGAGRGWVQLIWAGERRCAVHRLWTLSPGGGNGSMMLKALCRLADRHGIEIALRPLPFGRKPYPLARQQLIDWYARHGFERAGRKMIRRPAPPHGGVGG